jgi:hypothetical protein
MIGSSISLYLLHEHRFNKIPVFGSDYYYLPYALPDDKTPSHSIENTEVTMTGFLQALPTVFKDQRQVLAVAKHFTAPNPYTIISTVLSTLPCSAIVWISPRFPY